MGESNNQCPNPTTSSTTYGAQSTFVVRFEDSVNSKYTFMAMFDVWNSPNVGNATFVCGVVATKVFSPNYAINQDEIGRDTLTKDAGGLMIYVRASGTTRAVDLPAAAT